jgi:hypothetical protein
VLPVCENPSQRDYDGVRKSLTPLGFCLITMTMI